MEHKNSHYEFYCIRNKTLPWGQAKQPSKDELSRDEGLFDRRVQPRLEIEKVSVNWCGANRTSFSHKPIVGTGSEESALRQSNGHV